MSTIRVKELERILKGENTSDDIQFYHDIEDNYDDNWFITSMYEDDEGDLILESSADEDETLSVGDILDGLDDYSAGTKIYLYDSDDDEYYHIELCWSTDDFDGVFIGVISGDEDDDDDFDYLIDCPHCDGTASWDGNFYICDQFGFRGDSSWNHYEK